MVTLLRFVTWLNLFRHLVVDQSNQCNTVNYRPEALGLYIFVSGFRMTYRRKGLYSRGLITGIEKTLRTSQRSVDQNTFCV